MAEKKQPPSGSQQPPRKPSPSRQRRGGPQRPTVVMPPRRNKNLMMVLLLVMMGFLMMRFYAASQAGEQVERTTFLGWMADSTVAIHELQLQRVNDAIFLSGRRSLLPGETATPAARNPLLPSRAAQAPTPEGKPFTTYLLQADHDLMVEWEASKAPLKIEVLHDDTSWLEHLFAFLPVFLLIGFFWFMMARQNGAAGGKSPFSFGKSRAKIVDSGRIQTTFKDVAGCDEAKEDLREIVDFLKNPKKFSDLGGRIPKGVLLLGPPGTGKTLLARAVAGEAKRPFFSMSGSDFVEMFVGVGASRVRDLFEQGRKNAPCIIFIDEIDAVGRQRGAGLGGGHDEREQTLNQLLVEMDGFEGSEGVILLAATNRPDVLDRALLRPGRLDRRVVVDAPDAKGREEILKIHINKRKVPLHKDVDLQTVAKGTPGMSGADLENLVNEAALLAARYDAKKVSMIDFEEAKDKLMMGPERRSRVLSEEEKRTTAYHEAGHALVTHLVENSDPLHKLTIIPRGMALGITFSLPEKDRYTMDRAFLEDKIAVLLAGRATEWLMFKQRTTGASNDLERATDIARRMTTEWGMTEELGPIVYRKKKEDVFLGRDLSERPEHSEITAQRIDEVVRELVERQNERVEKILSDNKEKLVALAEALLEHEVLDREEILKVLDGESLESSKKSRQYQKLQQAEERRQKKEREDEELKRIADELAKEREKELEASDGEQSEESSSVDEEAAKNSPLQEPESAAEESSAEESEGEALSEDESDNEEK